MATLVSAGVDVSIINEAFYGSAGAGTVPLIVFATASNKAAVGTTGIAPGTLPSQAGSLFLATGQRDAVQQFGVPGFKSAGGTPLHGHELNEYGLHAAYSFLGIANRAYMLRGDIDLAALEPTVSAPRGEPVGGTLWLDLSETTFGLFRSNGSSTPGLGWESKTVLVPTADDLTSDVPKSGYGSNGNYAVVTTTTDNYFYEKISGSWVRIGSGGWSSAHSGCSVTYTNTPQYPDPGNAGSIWIKLSAPNNGAAWKIKRYNATTGLWVATNASFQAFDSTADDGEAGKDTAQEALGSVPTNYTYVGFDNTYQKMEIRRWNGTNYETASYEASLDAPTTSPEDGTLWYNASLFADIMVTDGSQWSGYREYYPNTDPNGVIIAGSAPTQQSDNTALVDNDLWLDSSDLENYPRLYRWSTTRSRWALIDNTDQTTPFGIVFADARENAGPTESGDHTTAYSEDASELVLSQHVDPDAPEPRAYPDGMLLFNTRRSTYNVKVWRPNYFLDGGYDAETNFTLDNYSVGSMELAALVSAGRWVTASGNKTDGSPYMGRKAQRIMVVRSLAAAISSNEDIRSEIVYYNLIAAPGYPELLDELNSLNIDNKEVSFIIGDTPARLAPTGTAINNWAKNALSVASNGEDGLTLASDNVGIYYPWGLGTNSDGSEIMIPPSTIALRTVAYSDQVSFPWFAPAGFQRGLVSNAASVGYLTSESEYRAVVLNQGQRDVLYTNKINPIAYIPGRGLVVYGQKTLSALDSALDRINVARLANYLRYNLDNIVKPFLFEQNDSHTRDAARLTVERFLLGLVGLRALEDYAVLCDETNNTPERRDRNELWIDIIVKPIKAIEFIYIPVRIRNSGDSLTF